MNRRWFFSWLLLCLAVPAAALDYSGNIAAEWQVFPEQARYVNQLDDNLTLSFKPKWRQAWNQGDDEVTVELFLRADDKDEERNHADIRELKWLHVSGQHEWRVGIDSVFWGVTESQHLVDVINQIDRVEGIDGEDKLGQPMIHYTAIQDWGVLHLFVLPGFREATFHAEQGRLRLPLPVDTSQTQYESADEDQHVDYALRYSHYVGDTEFGLSAFDGTRRDAQFSQGFDQSGRPVLIPYYAQMTQIGLDLQSIVGDWTWKLEMIRRELEDEVYRAATAGFEYTFYSLAESAIDLGTLVEYSWDSRSQNAGVFDNDIFAGLRFAFNDVQSSEILAGVIVDTDKHSRSLRAEASRRLGNSWKLSAELQVFSNIAADDPLSAYAADDYLMLELARYF